MRYKIGRFTHVCSWFARLLNRHIPIFPYAFLALAPLCIFKYIFEENLGYLLTYLKVQKEVMQYEFVFPPQPSFRKDT